MIKYLKNKVVTDVLTHWGTSIPLFVGTSTMLLSPLLGLGVGFLGFVAIVGGVGWAATNFTLNFDKIADQNLKDIQAEKMRERERSLDELHAKLVKTKDESDEQLLEWLRSLYRTFLEDIKEGKYTEYVNSQIMKQIEELFQNVVTQLQFSFDQWEDAGNSPQELSRKILKERKKTLSEVENAIASFNETLAGIRSLTVSSKREDLKRVSQKVNDSLNIARGVHEEMEQIKNISKGIISE